MIYIWYFVQWLIYDLFICVKFNDTQQELLTIIRGNN